VNLFASRQNLDRPEYLLRLGELTLGFLAVLVESTPTERSRNLLTNEQAQTAA
jgi:hypothetical protein